MHPFVTADGAVAIDRLLDGNRRYRQGAGSPASLTEQMRIKTARVGQRPFATVIACSDSRVPVEHIFSAGIGELFVIRTAGNTIGHLERGSVEYALEILKTPLVLVLGHTGCGAIKASLEHADLENAVIREIVPAIHGLTEPRACERANVLNSIHKLEESALISQCKACGQVMVTGGIYNLETGMVELLPA